MKSFNYKALAVAAASACGASAAIAGTVTAPAAPIKFAREAVLNTTTVTIPTLTYQMGVSRASNQNFTFIVKVPSSAVTFSGTCPTGANVTSDTNLALALKRQSATECAYDVTVDATNGSANGALITLSNLAVTNHALGDGTNLTVLVNLADPGETSRVDNSADVSVTLGTSTRIVSLTANKDTHTTADVNFNSGNSPLFGFLANTASSSSTVNDTSTDTYANFTINVNSTGYVIADGATTANAANALANITLTVAGDFGGLVTNFTNGNSAVTLTGNATAQPVTYANGSAVFTLANTALAAGGTTNVQVKLTTAASQSLGTERKFGVSGSVRGIAGASTTYSVAGNTDWWVWTANAIELRSAFFNNDGTLTRFFFQNTGAPASYSAVCHGEPTRKNPDGSAGATTVTYGSAQKGELATGTTAITAKDICTFATAGGTNVTRGSIVFTINSAVGKVKAVYQQAINGTAAGYIPLERPYGTNTY